MKTVATIPETRYSAKKVFKALQFHESFIHMQKVGDIKKKKQKHTLSLFPKTAISAQAKFLT